MTSFAIPIEHPTVDSVGAVLDLPRGSARARPVLLAHGSGADMHSTFMQAAAAGLVELGFPVMRFRYAYMERMVREGRRRPPERAPVLEAVHRAALARLVREFPGERPLLAGKSLGGRMSTHLAAQGEDAAGLILFGYPLHPAKRPEKERSEHFPAIVQPALFLQGTRDALCELPRLERALTTYGGAAQLHVVEAADHGFDVLVRSGRTQAQVLAELFGAIDAWERESFPA